MPDRSCKTSGLTDSRKHPTLPQCILPGRTKGQRVRTHENDENGIVLGDGTGTDGISSAYRVRSQEGSLFALLSRLPKVERSHKEELVPNTSNRHVYRLS